MCGWNPIWNTILESVVSLDEKLEFASNIMLQFYCVDVCVDVEVEEPFNVKIE